MKSKYEKISAMYEEYLKESLDAMTPEEVKEEFIRVALSMTDFSDPQVYTQVLKILVAREQQKRATAQQGDTEQQPESSGELDFTSMTKPNDFDELISCLKDYSSSHSINMMDVLNATTVAQAIREYMFDIEVPWVGIAYEMLTIAWSRNDKRTMMIHFLDGQIQAEFTHKEEKFPINFDDDGEIVASDVLNIVKEAYQV